MKKFFISLFLLVSFTMAFSQTQITLSANGKSMTATLAENEAAEALLKMLPVTIEMDPYGGFEVVGALPASLPTSNSRITTEPGDIMLYQGNQLVIFYGTNSWSYTRIGKIDDATSEKVKDFLGTGSVRVTLSFENARVGEIPAERDTPSDIYDLGGRKGNKNPNLGLYIVNGKKRFVKNK